MREHGNYSIAQNIQTRPNLKRFISQIVPSGNRWSSLIIFTYFIRKIKKNPNPSLHCKDPVTYLKDAGQRKIFIKECHFQPFGDLFSENLMKISDNWRRKNHISSVLLQTGKFLEKYFSLRRSCYSFVYFFLNNLLVDTYLAGIYLRTIIYYCNCEIGKEKITGSFLHKRVVVVLND